jgi:hypothetical protein
MRVDPAVSRHPRITLGPQFALDARLGLPPWPEQETIGLEHGLVVWARRPSHAAHTLTTTVLNCRAKRAIAGPRTSIS